MIILIFLIGIVVVNIGIIGFVGLVILYIICGFVGGNYKKVILIVIFLGVVFLVFIDILIRIVVLF